MNQQPTQSGYLPYQQPQAGYAPQPPSSSNQFGVPAPVSRTFQRGQRYFQRMSPRQRNTLLIVIGVVVIVLVVGGIIHYNAPVSVAQGFMQNYASNSYSAELGQICDSPDGLALRIHTGQVASVSQRDATTFTATKLSYTQLSETTFGAAVTFSGPITRSNKATSNVTGVITLDSSGFWWCVASIAFNR